MWAVLNFTWPFSTFSWAVLVLGRFRECPACVCVDGRAYQAKEKLLAEDDTYAGPSASTAAAAKPAQPSPDPETESHRLYGYSNVDFLDKWCIDKYEAQVTQLQRVVMMQAQELSAARA